MATPVYDTPYKHGVGSGLTWAEMTQAWSNTPETWEGLGGVTWSSTTKN